MSANLPALLAQSTDDSNSATERLFAAVALRKQIDSLIEALDGTAAVTALVASDALSQVEGRSGSYDVKSGAFTAMTKDEAQRLWDSMSNKAQ